MNLGLGAPARQGAQDNGPKSGELGQRHEWLLAVTCVAQFMVILDLTIVNVALPSIQSSLNFSSVDLQWVVDAYAIVFAGFLMLGGRASDHFGQRRTFVFALVLFAATSLAGGASIDHQMLIVARGLQGLSGALMAATSLAIITASFPRGPARHRAIGLWGAMNGLGGAAGTLLGGVITEGLGWRWVLLINPPIGIAAAVIAHRAVTERRREDARGFDLAGALSLTVGTLVLVYGIVDTGVDGWTSARSLVPIAIGAALLALFGVVEAHFSKAPLVPFRALTRPLQLANLIVLLFSAALFPMWYVSSLYLQQVLGLSPVATGLTFFPMALAIMLSASQAGKLVSRFGVRQVMGSGLVLMAGGMLLFARIGASGSALGYVVLPGVLTAIGIGLSIVPSTIFATQGAGPAQAGLASGLVNTSRQAGGGLGLAVLITLATRYTSGAVGHNTAESIALTDGFRLAYLVGAGLVVAAAAVTFAFGQLGEAQPAPDQAAHQPVALPPGSRPRLAAVVVLVIAGFAALDFGAAGGTGAPIGAYTTEGAYSFVSAPGLHPPKIVADMGAAGRVVPGYIILGNFYDLTSGTMVGQSGPLILDNHVQPVWFRPAPKDALASNLEVQTYHGHPVLTWWQGVVSRTGLTESGEDIVVNQHYQQIVTLKGQDGWVPTLHEMVISGNDAWVTADKNIPMNLSRYGGTSDGVLDDSAVQEYDLATGKLVYTWDALDHLPLSDSHAQPPANGFPWDAYHVNSISLAGEGKFLVSMRNTWAAYMVDAKSGQIDWQLGGKHSSFKVPRDALFQWQHDVRLHPGSVVTLFNDNCCQISGAGTYLAPAGPSKGLVLKLDLKAGTVTLLAQYTHGKGYAAAYMGNVELLPGGNVFIGWGQQPNFSEYTKSGKLIFDASFPGPDLSYRALVEQWEGLPLYPPKATAIRTATGTAIYASWNGATNVAAWRALAGSNQADLAPVSRKAKIGFETAFQVKGNFNVFEVQALNAKGQVIGTSKPFSSQSAGRA
jgi:EmrB/QacA subfamily drug resistance transporter